MNGEISYYGALWRMGKLPPERIPDVACEALQEGMDNPLLRQLAGLEKPTRRELGTKFDDACQQLGIIPTSTARAYRYFFLSSQSPSEI